MIEVIEFKSSNSMKSRLEKLRLTIVQKKDFSHFRM